MEKISCVFCEIIQGKLPANVIKESNTCIAFTPKEIEVEGHLLVVPKEHCNNILDISRESLLNLTGFLKETCIFIKKEYGYSGFNLLNASGESAQQSVKHFHFHIIPRKEADGFDAWPTFGKAKDFSAHKKR